jgi:hypothetical protein
LPLRCCTGAAAGDVSDVGSFDVVGSDLEGAVDGVALLGESLVLTAVLGASEGVCAPVPTAVLEASDVVCAPVDVEDPDTESVEAAVGE